MMREIEIYFSDFTEDAQQRLLEAYGVSSAAEANWDSDILPIVILEIEEDDQKSDKFNVRKFTNDELVNVSRLLHEIGIPSNLSGYQFIITAMEALTVYDRMTITGELYPYIAKEYNTTSTAVERSIRHAISVGFNRGDADILNKIFANSVDSKKGVATNGEFLYTIAQKIRLEIIK